MLKMPFMMVMELMDRTFTFDEQATIAEIVFAIVHYEQSTGSQAFADWLVGQEIPTDMIAMMRLWKGIKKHL